jgi:hypothetical protein
MLPGRLTGDAGGDPDWDSGGVVGSMSKDSVEARLPRRRGAEDPSAAGPSSSALPGRAADLESAPNSTVLGDEASGG